MRSAIAGSAEGEPDHAVAGLRSSSSCAAPLAPSRPPSGCESVASLRQRLRRHRRRLADAELRRRCRGSARPGVADARRSRSALAHVARAASRAVSLRTAVGVDLEQEMRSRPAGRGRARSGAAAPVRPGLRPSSCGKKFGNGEQANRRNDDENDRTLPSSARNKASSSIRSACDRQARQLGARPRP